ncbi:MAG: hypothetical protein M1838_000300 [Thelocarpon superellum]|nr:MAG: hypothetical protein M1838_000300 [Thelocarpon superellum]
MDHEDAVAQFTGITGSNPRAAQQYLELADGNLEQAIQLFFDSGGIELDGQEPASAPAAPSGPPAPAPASAPTTATRQASTSARPPPGSRRITGPLVNLDSDEEISDDNDPEITGWNRRAPTESTGASAPAGISAPLESTALPGGRSVEDDEAFARRMQEELYAGGDGSDGTGRDADGVRAPMARTTETLVGPHVGLEREMFMDPRAAVEAQLAARRDRSARPGIFNQRATAASVWDEEVPQASQRRQVLAQATGGASEASSKASLLAEMYRPPHEIMSRLPWDQARDEGKARERWLLVNVQDPSVFDCQILNRDIWKHAEIKETIREHFIFMQYNKDDPLGAQYMQFYFKNQDLQDAYPHIAIVDPRTGEQVKVWSGPPVPKPLDYLMQLHEFLDRYSLKAHAKNPVATRRPEKKKPVDVEQMTEEEMLEMAMQNSLGHARTPVDLDPDALTRHESGGSRNEGKGKGRADDASIMDADAGTPNGHAMTGALAATPSVFAGVATTHAHVEPPADPARVTRIQFRHAGGRIIRRFAHGDPVRRIYEWLKAEPLEGKAGIEFELVCMGKNLLEHIDETIEQAGLKNQTVMIEFLEG